MKDGYEECGLCGAPLDETETQYCAQCELMMLKEIELQIEKGEKE
ncbi:MAG TPA: hypothetical protein VMH89_10490 [Candidatus Acidoferrum sp.]|nr:hypothetical protein [Candidatus Acidoferrum sp.]